MPTACSSTFPLLLHFASKLKLDDARSNGFGRALAKVSTAMSKNKQGAVKCQYVILDNIKEDFKSFRKKKGKKDKDFRSRIQTSPFYFTYTKHFFYVISLS